MHAPKIKQTVQHFSQIAKVYRWIRITDPEPVEIIAAGIKKIGLIIADIGCGTGRYTELLIRNLQPQICYCIDATAAMLERAQACLKPLAHQTQLCFFESLAKAMPIASGSLDLMTTFNAIHHFVAPQFLKEAARTLKPGGFLCIYTRTPQQNRRTIWGKHFPLFGQKENRLLPENKLSQLISGTPPLRLYDICKFIFPRSSSLEQLKDFALKHCYSTFSLYSLKDFEACLDQFIKKLSARYPDPNRIEYTAENTLYIVQKSC